MIARLSRSGCVLAQPTGDRIAVLDRDIAVVKRLDDGHVHALLWNREILRLDCKGIIWVESNMRYEATPHACVETKAKA